MSKIDDYRNLLKHLESWEDFLIQESRLPGPRANLELAEAVAAEGDLDRFSRYLAYDASQAPFGSALEFLPVCGMIGMGRLLAQGRRDLLEVLRPYASDPRWRIRESVAIALQKLGDADLEALLQAMESWSRGNLLERRAAAAALCEPRLLKKTETIRRVLDMLDRITEEILEIQERGNEPFRALRQSLGYCWSVAAAADMVLGKPCLEKWFQTDQTDIRWIMKENLKKARLERQDPAWTARWRRELDHPAGRKPIAQLKKG